MTPVGLKLGLLVGALEGDFVGCTDGVGVGYSEQWKDKWVQMKKYVIVHIFLCVIKTSVWFHSRDIQGCWDNILLGYASQQLWLL